jgi:hypothetical protein
MIIKKLMIFLLLASTSFGVLYASDGISTRKKGFNLIGHPSGNNINILYTQIDRLEELLTEIHDRGYEAKDIWMRIRAGNGSQQYGIENFPVELCELWGVLQEQYQFKIIFGINYNKDVSEDLEIFNRLVDSGVELHAIEYGNEQYLSKFNLGPDEVEDGSCDLDHHSGVVSLQTCGMSPEKYVSMTLPRIEAFNQFNLPHFVQFAPKGKVPLADEYYEHWNNTVMNAINLSPQVDIHGVLHIYTDDLESFPFSLIHELRNEMPEGRKVFITEFGYRFDEDSILDPNISGAELVELEVELMAAIENFLNDDEVAFNHHAYNDYSNISSVNAWVNSTVGITTKGQIMLETFYPVNGNCEENDDPSLCIDQRVCEKLDPQLIVTPLSPEDRQPGDIQEFLINIKNLHSPFCDSSQFNLGFTSTDDLVSPAGSNSTINLIPFEKKEIILEVAVPNTMTTWGNKIFAIEFQDSDNSAYSSTMESSVHVEIPCVSAAPTLFLSSLISEALNPGETRVYELTLQSHDFGECGPKDYDVHYNSPDGLLMGGSTSIVSTVTIGVGASKLMSLFIKAPSSYEISGIKNFHIAISKVDAPTQNDQHVESVSIFVPCIKKDPIINLTLLSNPPFAADSVLDYNIELINRNSLSCGEQVYELSFESYDGLESNIPPNGLSIPINPESSVSGSFQLQVPVDMTVGNKNFNIKLKKQNSDIIEAVIQKQVFISSGN